MNNKKEKLQNEAPVETPVKPDMYSTELVPVLRRDQLRKVRRLTRDIASITVLGEALVMAQSNLYTITMADKFNPGVMRDVQAFDCLDCLRGDEYTLVCSTVMKSTFERYGDGLQGKYFAIRAGEIPAGKRYRKIEIMELERID